MDNAEFLCLADEIGEGEFHERSAVINGEPSSLILTRHRRRVQAWLNICPHQGRALNWAPSRFLTNDDGQLVCAAHGAVFRNEDGRCVSGPCLNASLKAVAIDEDKGRIRIISST